MHCPPFLALVAAFAAALGPCAARTATTEFEVLSSFPQDGSLNVAGRFPGPFLLAPDGSMVVVATEGGHHGFGVLLRWQAGAVEVLHHFGPDRLDRPASGGQIAMDASGAVFGARPGNGRSDPGGLWRWHPADGYRRFASLAGTDAGSSPVVGVTRAADGTLFGATSEG